MKLRLPYKIVLLIIAFNIGGVLLSLELIISKLLDPFFGRTLYVWASVIASTMLGLAFGYLYSSTLIQKTKNLNKSILYLLVLVGLYLLMLPISSTIVFNVFISTNLKVGVVVSTLILNFPIYFILGLFSPILVELYAKETKEVGKIAGYIYALSTLGGVVFLVLVGFYGFPLFGINETIYCLGINLELLGLLYYFHIEK